MKIKDIKIGKRFRKDLGDIESLKKSIQEVGLLHPIVVDENNNLIVGGRRVEAFKQLDEEEIPHRVLPSENKELKETDENVIRKNWTPSEAVDIWESLQSFQGQQPQSDSDRSQRRNRAAKRTGYSHDSLSKAKQVVEDGELIEEMNRTGNINSVYRKLQRKKDEEELKKNPPKPIDGTFATIVIDPPWEYDENVLGRTTPEYALMNMEELEEEKIMKYAQNSCHLYIWTTNAFIWKAIELGKKWGFEYKTCITWCKDKIGIGTYFRNSTEHICFFIKEGSKNTRDKTIGTWFKAERREHSVKPDKAYEIIEKASYPPYLNIFGRKERKGWTVYGNIKNDK